MKQLCDHLFCTYNKESTLKVRMRTDFHFNIIHYKPLTCPGRNPLPPSHRHCPPGRYPGNHRWLHWDPLLHRFHSSACHTQQAVEKSVETLSLPPAGEVEFHKNVYDILSLGLTLYMHISLAAYPLLKFPIP